MTKVLRKPKARAQRMQDSELEPPQILRPLGPSGPTGTLRTRASPTTFIQ